jgi:hypothetical protein
VIDRGGRFRQNVVTSGFHQERTRQRIAVGLLPMLALPLITGSWLGIKLRGEAPLGQRRPSIGANLQEEGPLLDGQRLTLHDAERRTPFRLAIPPSNDISGKLAGIWMDATDQVGFVWDTNLRYYCSELPADVTEQEMVREWRRAGPDKATGQSPQLVNIRGHTALGYEKTPVTPDDSPSSLTFIENGLSIQFVSPNHTLDELTSMAKGMGLEPASILRQSFQPVPAKDN